MYQKLPQVAIVSAVRTPIGSFGGALSLLTASKLGAIAIQNAVAKANIDPKSVQQAILGNVLSAGQGQAPARQAAIYAGLPHSTVCTTINKVCASGMKAITLAAQDIMLGNHDVVVAGGFESMSNVPYYLEKGRTGLRLGHGQIVDGIIKDGLWDVYDNVHMGSAGERCAEKFQFSREEQDKFAINSYRRSADATKNGRFKDEIVPVTIPQKKGNPIVVSEDEEYQKIDLNKIASLKPAFEPQGTITAANASTLNDGGCAVVLMNADVAQKRGVKILAYVRGFADAEQAPLDFTTTPALATPLALQRAGIKQQDVDYWEINEAFSVVVLANQKLLGLDPERVNVDGGAVSLGHPIGMSGARLVTHLVHLLHNRNARYGSASICNGGGGATAIVIERA